MKHTPLFNSTSCGSGVFLFFHKTKLFFRGIGVMKFEESHKKFIEEHIVQRKNNGEGLRRLVEGHGHAEKLFLEKVWWPAFGDFDHLHPEFEVHDFKDGFRYIDFAYIRTYVQLAVEIDGFGPHWRNISRWQFSDHCRRQNDLILDGWKLLRFSYDDIKDHPRACQQVIQQFMGKWMGTEKLDQYSNISWLEKAIILFVMNLDRPITAKDLSDHMNIGNKTARKWLRQLTEKKWLVPAAGRERIHSYQLDIDGNVPELSLRNVLRNL